jgi:lysophospholipase
MERAAAPLWTDIAPGPADGAALWMRAPDGCRIRLAHWARSAPHGTVLLLPGRTEYIEKYGAAAQALADRGLATLCIDWRGQGLADRLAADARLGHVGDFADYQKDLDVMVQVARSLQMPRPYFLLAHSMGGGIGLRGLHRGLPVQAAVFTGPMWGIKIAPHMRPLAEVMGRVLPQVGLGELLTPGTKIEPYVLSEPFETNSLTGDRAMFDQMRAQVIAHPELALGGPSIAWLGMALRETADLAERPSPSTPCLTFLGSEEDIVDVPRIHLRMENWPGGHLRLMQGGRHEVLMESPRQTAPIFDEIAGFFRQNAAAGPGPR